MNVKNSIYKEFSSKFYLIQHALRLIKIGSKGNISKIIFLSLLLFISGFSDTLPILIVIPFLTLIGDPEKIWELANIKKISNFFNIYDPNDLILPALIFFIIAILLNTFLKTYIINLSNSTKNFIVYELRKIAFEKIINSKYEFIIDVTSGKILNEFSSSLGQCLGYIDGFLKGLTSLINTTFITIVLFFIDRNITLTLIISVGIIYTTIAKIKNDVLREQSQIISKVKEKQTELILETLGLKKDIMLENSQAIFMEKFSQLTYKHAFGETKLQTALEIPKYFVESIFILSIITFAYILKNNLAINPVPLLGGFAFGLQRLLPAAYGIFISHSTMKSKYYMTFDLLNLIYKTPQDVSVSRNYLNTKSSLIVNKIELKNISYKYPSTKNKIINNANLLINRGESIGIIGTTGSGKSTLIDLLMGFLQPTNGSILVDGIDINDKKNEQYLVKWRQSIAHVPQFIFLNNVSIIENIAFGEKLKDINFEKVVECCKAANIYEFIRKSEKGLYSDVGERGIKLSGGQLQRIALAKALYKEKDILILDEATSALDNNTERKIVESIKNYHKKLTIITIAHRLSTLEGYQRIIKINNGDIIEN